jgi:glycosyltransferase involved in cell wall biosynthesis
VTALVSILINNYNYAEYLGEAIDSALAQRYGNCEIIVVDDGSTDGSRAIVESYGTCVRAIYKENGGQASAFNVGIAASGGGFILLLDSDDILSPNAVTECVEAFPRGYSRVYFRLQSVDRQGRTLGIATPMNNFQPMDGYPVDCRSVGGMIYWGPPTSGNFFSASILRKILPIPERTYRICADAFVVAKTSMHGPVRSLDKTLGSYRLHGKNAFVSSSSDFSNAQRVNTHIRNYFTSTALAEEVCRARGVLRNPAAAESTFWFVHLLAAGWLSQVESVSELGIDRKEIASRVLAFLWLGTEPFLKRVVQSSYILCLLVAPRKVGLLIVKTVDQWKNRREGGT